MAPYVLLALLALISSRAMATDPSPLQDFCVADASSPTFVNGFVCKPQMNVTAEDFFFSGLDMPRNTSNRLGSKLTPVTAAQLPGLNTLGLSMVRKDYAPYGLNPPHFHPRATEIITVIEGTLYVGFVTSNTNNGNIFFSKYLNKGDAFVFPKGLVHFDANHGETPAVAISVLSSQNPGMTAIGDDVFGAKPPISDAILTKAFQVGKGTIDYLQAQFSTGN